MEAPEYTEAELIELYEERAAVREYDGGLSREDANHAAYYDWRAMVGSGVKTPLWIRERADKFKRK